MKRQILMRFMTIITVTVLLVIGILSFVTYNYYYVTATDVLKRHANASAVLFANSGLAYDYADSEATIHDVLDSYAYPDAEIEVLDATGIPRYSSTGFISERKLTREAVNQVRAGQTVAKRYDDETTGEHLLEVTEPVVSFGQTTGADLPIGGDLHFSQKFYEAVRAIRSASSFVRPPSSRSVTPPKNVEPDLRTSCLPSTR